MSILCPQPEFDKDILKTKSIGYFNSAINQGNDQISKEHAMKVWTLVNLPNGKRAIGTKWVFRNKKDDRGIVVRNKARLVAQSYTQEEVLIIIKMDVKSAYLKRLQVQQKEDGIFISQDKYVAEILKKFDFATVKTASTPMEPNKALIKDEEADSVDHFGIGSFSDSKYAGASLDRKAKTGAPEGESLAIPPEPQPTPSTTQPNVSKPQTESLQTETPLTVSHELQTKAHIEQILPSPSTYQRKHRKNQKHKRAKKVTDVERAITTDASLVAAQDNDNIIRTQTMAMPNVDIPQRMDTGGSPRRQETMWGAPARTRSERVLEKPNEPPLSEGHTSGSGEGSMEHTFEMMDTVIPTPHDSPLSRGNTPGIMMVEWHKFTNDGNLNLLDKKGCIQTGRESDKTKSMFQDSDFDVLDDDMEDVEGEIVHTATTGVSTVSAPITTTGVAISTAKPKTPPITVANAFIDEDLTIAQTLIKMKEEKPRDRVSIKTEEFDEIQARIDADHELAVRLTHEEQEKYTIEERARLLAEFFERRKK
ncbi:putative ribonuclease H-like domain-containing protein [Tanacetum coccineum]